MQDVILTSIPLETIELRFSNVVDQKFKEFFTQLQKQQNPATIEYLTRKEAANLLSVSLPTLNEWTKEGKVTGYRISSRVRYKRSELETSLVQIKTGRRAA